MDVNVGNRIHFLTSLSKLLVLVLAWLIFPLQGLLHSIPESCPSMFHSTAFTRESFNWDGQAKGSYGMGKVFLSLVF